MITSTDLISKFRYALDNEWGYIWGTAGEKWTAAKQKQIEQTTDADRALSREFGKKWIGHMVADCSGLFSWAFKQLGSKMYHGSDTMYRKWCVNHGELSKGKRTDGATLKPGTAVFVWNGKKYSHVGLYVGDGIVIEAMGTKNGVTTTKVTASKWTHWGELQDVSFEEGGIGEPAYYERPANETQIDGKPTIRKGSKGGNVIELQSALVKLGYGIGPCGIDGDFGSATSAAVEQFQLEHQLTVDGICGPKTWAALEKALEVFDKPAEPITITYTVMIPGLDLTQAQALAGNYPGAEIVEGRVAG